MTEHSGICPRRLHPATYRNSRLLAALRRAESRDWPSLSGLWAPHPGRMPVSDGPGSMGPFCQSRLLIATPSRHIGCNSTPALLRSSCASAEKPRSSVRSERAGPPWWR